MSFGCVTKNIGKPIDDPGNRPPPIQAKKGSTEKIQMLKENASNRIDRRHPRQLKEGPSLEQKLPTTTKGARECRGTMEEEICS